MNEDELLAVLLQEYPECEIENISNNRYYRDIRALALEKELTVTQYLTQLGFELSRGSLGEEEAILALMEAFPNGKVQGLLTNHNKLARTLNQIAEKANKTLEELLLDYGMKVIRKGSLSVEEVIAELKQDFPDGKVFSLNQTHKKQYYVLQRAAKDRGITLKAFLAEYDIKVVRKMQGQKDIQAIPVEVAVLEKEKYLNKTKYDEELMKELVEEYNFTVSDFAIYLGVTRQAIDLKMKRINSSFFSWEVKKLSNEHLSFLKQMLKEEIAFSQSDTYFYQISFNPIRTKFAISIFPKDLSEFPLCWRDDSLSDELIEELYKKDYHIFSNNDFTRLQNIRTSNVEEYSLRSGKLYIIFRTLAQKHYDYCFDNGVLTDFYADEETHGTRFEQFAKLKGLDYEVQDKRFISDEEIISILETFKNPITNIVKIPISDQQHHRMVRLAKNRGYSLKTFIESFGYNYKRLRIFDEGFKRKKRQKRLDHLENYKVTEDAVYISPYGKFYTNLTNEGKSKGHKNLTEYLLHEFGLKRLYRHDLPEDYIPYELGDSEEDLDKEEKFLKHIENHLMLSDEDSYFYIDSGTNFYWAILKYTTLIGISVDDFFEKWELKRLNYSDALNYLISEIDFTKEEAEVFLDRTKYTKYNDDDVENKEEMEEGEETIEEAELPLNEEERESDSNSNTDSDDEKRTVEEESEDTASADDEQGIQENEEDTDVADLDENLLLDFLKNISNQIVDAINIEEKKKRSQLLVRKMKELYDYKCQLCDPNNPIPVIEMTNGKAYVEMHHIIALSSSSAEDETDLILDNYANCVVVCSHHHKLLHYHRGGFTEFDEMIDGLYFVNDETEVKIHLNKHLSI